MSFVTAANLGAECTSMYVLFLCVGLTLWLDVELDVQLTSDNVPVMYELFECDCVVGRITDTCLCSYHNWTVEELTGFDIPIHMLTLKQFLALKEAKEAQVCYLTHQYVSPLISHLLDGAQCCIRYSYVHPVSLALIMLCVTCSFCAGQQKRKGSSGRPRSHSNPEIEAQVCPSSCVQFLE